MTLPGESKVPGAPTAPAQGGVHVLEGQTRADWHLHLRQAALWQK